jgi:hypothetical protein
MSLFERLRYALYLAIVGGALIGLLVSVASADVVGLLPIAAFDMLVNPLYWVALYIVAFAAAPLVADRLPIARSAPRSGK